MLDPHIAWYSVTSENSIGVKKFRYTAYRNMPRGPMRNGVFHMCIEGFFESQQKRE